MNMREFNDPEKVFWYIPIAMIILALIQFLTNNVNSGTMLFVGAVVITGIIIWRRNEQ